MVRGLTSIIVYGMISGVSGKIRANLLRHLATEYMQLQPLLQHVLILDIKTFSVRSSRLRLSFKAHEYDPYCWPLL